MAKRGDAETTAVRAVVRGEVQAVGFRDAALRRARRLGVMGWVRNAEDGNVLVHAEGSEREVEERAAGFEVNQEVDVAPGLCIAAGK